MEIKTLAQILAENSDKTPKQNKPKKQQQTGQIEHQQYSTNKKNWAQSPAARHRAASQLSNDPYTSPNIITDNPNTNSIDGLTSEAATSSTANGKRRRSKKKKQFHPASPYQPKVELAEPVKEVDPNSIKSLLAQVKAEAETEQIQTTEFNPELNTAPTTDSALEGTTDSSIDNLPKALKVYLKTPEQREAEKEAIKAESRLRWLAFYYLSRREHSAQELKDKLIAKEQDPERIDALLEEFREKGYQSDYRTAIMLIREGIRKRHGRVRIKNDFYTRKVDMPTNIDELIDMAMADNEDFADVLSDNELVYGVDWLRLAVEARVKKYGDEIPTEPKIKDRQLRFLQYRGFKPNICFEAIKYNLQTLDERF